jgi:hypothetical protein
MTDEQKKAQFLDRVKAMPDKERDAFWRGILAVSEAGRKAGIPAKDWANYCAETYKVIGEQLKETT